MKFPNQSSGIIRTAHNRFQTSSNNLGIQLQQAFPTAEINPLLVQLSSDWCCAEGSNPIQNPENCHQLLFGPFGICRQIRWKCTKSAGGVATGCTSQFSTFQSITT
jgi:hypothetical protein